MSEVSVMLAGLALGFSLIVAMGPQNILLIKQGIRREGITAVVAVCFVSDVILFVAGVLGVGKLTEAIPAALEVLRWVGAAYLAWFALISFRDCLRPKTEREQPVSVVEETGPEQAGTTGQARSGAETAASVAVSPGPADGGGAAAAGGGPGGSPAPVPASGAATALDTRERPAPGAEHRRHRRPAWVGPMLSAIVLTWLNPGAYLDSLVMIGGIAHQYGDPGAWWFITGALTASAIWFTGVGYGAGLLSRPLSSPRVWRVLNGAFGVILVGLVWRLVTM